LPRKLIQKVRALGAAAEAECVDACPEPFLRQDKLRRGDGFDKDDNVEPQTLVLDVSEVVLIFYEHIRK